MAAQAGRRAVQHCGITYHEVIPCRSKDECHKRKLTAFLDYDEPVWSIDADWFAVRSVSLPTPSSNICYGAPNDSGVDAYTGSCVPPKSAICSCLVGLDMGDDRVRTAVNHAINMQMSSKVWMDEVHLNHALFRSKELSVVRLSNYWNWCGRPVPLTVAIHAAGRDDKEQWLLENSKLAGD